MVTLTILYTEKDDAIYLQKNTQSPMSRPQTVYPFVHNLHTSEDLHTYA